MVLRSFGKSLNNAINKLINKGPADAALIKELKNDILRALLEADIELSLASQVVTNVEARSLSEELPPGLERNKAVINIVYEELTKIMGEKFYPLSLEKEKTNILMAIGIQGSGKTTTIAKLARLLTKENWNVGLICTDTWRPGAYEQLTQLGEQIGVEVFGEPTQKNPIKIAKNGIKHFKEKRKNLILVDTAGRHKEEKSLIKEMKELNKKLKPQEIILVIDGTLGQKAKIQAMEFHEATPIGSIIVTKLDSTAKGGGAISASASTGAPIKYIGLGEKVNDIEKFEPKKFVGRILGLGDIETLLEEVKKAQLSVDEDRTAEMMKGKFTYTDIIGMFESMNKMGGVRKILDLLPGGMTHQVDDNMLNMSKETMERNKNIIQSMTQKERNAEVKLSKTRIERIAIGSGVSIDHIKELVNQKKMAEKMVRQMTKPRRGKGNKNSPFGNLPFNFSMN